MAEENRLRWAPTTMAVNTRQDITIAHARVAVRTGLEIVEEDFSVRAFAPENFMFNFQT